MRIVCDSCRTEFEVELPASMKHRAMKFRCSSCGRTFTTRFEEDDHDDTEVEPTGTATRTPLPPTAEAHGPGPGMLLKQEGKVYHVKDTATMQKWIVERRVLREDLVSIGGVRWEPVGSRPELEVFFQVVEQADQLQVLAGGGPPLAPAPPVEKPPRPLPGPDFSSSSGSDVTAATELVVRQPSTQEDPTPLSGEDVDDEDSEDTSAGIAVGLPPFPEPQMFTAAYERPDPVDLLQADPEDVLDPFSIDAYPSGLPDSDEPTDPGPATSPGDMAIDIAGTPTEQVPFSSRFESPRNYTALYTLGAFAMVALAGGIYIAHLRSDPPVPRPATEIAAPPIAPPIAPAITPPIAPAVDVAVPPPTTAATVVTTPAPAPAVVEPKPAEPPKPAPTPSTKPPQTAVVATPVLPAPDKPKDPAPTGPHKPTAAELQALISKAWSAADKSDFVSARKLFAQVQAYQPRHAEAAYGLGYTTEKLGDSRESAITYYCTAKKNVGSNKDLAREVAGRLQALGSDCAE